jgi:hypothetical protein
MQPEKPEPGSADDDLRPEYDIVELLKGATRGKYAARRKAMSPRLLHPEQSKAFVKEVTEDTFGASK